MRDCSIASRAPEETTQRRSPWRSPPSSTVTAVGAPTNGRRPVRPGAPNRRWHSPWPTACEAPPPITTPGPRTNGCGVPGWPPPRRPSAGSNADTGGCSDGSCGRPMCSRPDRERSKTTVIEAIHGLRVRSMALGRRVAERGGGEPDDLWFVLSDELEDYLDEPASFTEAIAERRATRKLLAALEPPFVFDGAIPPIDQWTRRGDAVHQTLAVGEALTGIAGCAGIARGRACVVIDPADPGDLGPGDVLIAPSTDPAWTPLFVPVEAVVVDVGAQMSHAVIVSPRTRTALRGECHRRHPAHPPRCPHRGRRRPRRGAHDPIRSRPDPRLPPVIPEEHPNRPYEGFGGEVGRVVGTSTPDWPAYPTAPPGAPNVVVMLADDLGLRRPRLLRLRDRHAAPRPAGRDGLRSPTST